MSKTRNDILNESDAEMKIRLIFDKWDCCCRQRLGKTKEEKEKVWKELCRVKYRDEDGCKRCRADFLNEDV